MTTPLPTRAILPTAPLIEDMITNLAAMSIADYDLDELIVNTISALTVASEIKTRFAQFVEMYTRWGSGRPYCETDGQLMAREWLRFATAVYHLYRSFQLWDSTGTCNYYFEKMHGRDIVLCRYPD